jgi:hypothetical protein
VTKIRGHVNLASIPKELNQLQDQGYSLLGYTMTGFNQWLYVLEMIVRGALAGKIQIKLKMKLTPSYKTMQFFC